MMITLHSTEPICVGDTISYHQQGKLSFAQVAKVESHRKNSYKIRIHPISRFD